ncbi:hypothetical protein BYT27DRAFT_7261789 [Phlegmacium glaucopus]|nr:hypothetical protein BYT27DRAFT_7261789 [Phlegmacium glaucopus]
MSIVEAVIDAVHHFNVTSDMLIHQLLIATLGLLLAMLSHVMSEAFIRLKDFPGLCPSNFSS